MRASVRSCVPRAFERELFAGDCVEPIPAEVVRAALQQRHARGAAQRRRDQRQILREKLVLQRARAGGDEHAPARQQRRHEVREGLAGARARLDDEGFAVLERPRHALGHAQLLPPEAEVRQRPLQGAFGPENILEIEHFSGWVGGVGLEVGRGCAAGERAARYAGGSPCRDAYHLDRPDLRQPKAPDDGTGTTPRGSVSTDSVLRVPASAATGWRSGKSRRRALTRWLYLSVLSGPTRSGPSGFNSLEGQDAWQRPRTSSLPSTSLSPQVAEWVESVRQLTQAKAVHWCDGSDAEDPRAHRQQLEKDRRAEAPEPARVPGLPPRPLPPQRRGARGAPHLHLHDVEGGRRPEQQLDGARRSAAPRWRRCSRAA